MKKDDAVDTQSLATEKLSVLQKEILARWQKKQRRVLTQAVKDALAIKFAGDILYDEPMARHTAIKIGGPAECFLRPQSKEAVVFAVTLAHEHGVPLYFHGAGANTLVRDGGIKGLVLSPYDALKTCHIQERLNDHVDMYAESGVSFNTVLRLSRDEGLLDLAPFVGIPGSVGGFIRMNAGTHVREVKDVVTEVSVITNEGELCQLLAPKMQFSYRHTTLPKSHFILSANFRLREFATKEEVEAKMRDYQRPRTETQPLEFPNLGSIFKNPQPEGGKRLAMSAGALVEEAGLKNVRVGGARISAKHANFIINEGEAKAKDVLALIDLMKDRVATTTGVNLETEIVIVGEDE